MKNFKGFLVENPLSPTTLFKKFHGNYCGPGNKGGQPIDRLDRACFHHDVAYKKSRELPDKNVSHEMRKQADKHFVRRALAVASDKSHHPALRTKAAVAATYFSVKNKLRS